MLGYCLISWISVNVPIKLYINQAIVVLQNSTKCSEHVHLRAWIQSHYQMSPLASWVWQGHCKGPPQHRSVHPYVVCSHRLGQELSSVPMPAACPRPGQDFSGMSMICIHTCTSKPQISNTSRIGTNFLLKILGRPELYLNNSKSPR